MLETHSLTIPTTQSPAQKSARQVVLHLLSALENGQLRVTEHFDPAQPPETIEFGQSLPNQSKADIQIYHPNFYQRVLRGGSIAAAEAYIDGWWESHDLTQLMYLLAQNIETLDKLDAKTRWLTQWIEKLSHWRRRNTQKQAEENISAHYDLGNELYHAFLDQRMLYSAAIYQADDDSLEQAQINKMTRLCEQLQLKPQDHVIEIGTGWGAMAIFMAQQFGCKVTTTTISTEQYDYAHAQIERLGLSEQITLLKKDYRELTGQFDKLVSIEMIEAVGKQYLPSYIEQCHALLKPGGLMAIQAITIADQRYHSYANSVDFIQKYIFPGGFLPSVSVLTQMATERSSLVLRDLHDIGFDYAQTLREWRARFEAAQSHVLELGYDERFIRLWRYYFCYCEGGFLARTISTVQLTFERR